MTIACSGIIAGLLWAVIIEFYFDRTVRRPKDFERMLQIPLFLSIPDFGRKKHRQPVSSSNQNLTENVTVGEQARYSLPDWDTATKFGPYNETLRDRLVGYFESQNLTHKPKLVAVTGLARKSGVTTVASGLASSLSETGDGNVLLVDLTPGQGSARQFYRGRAVCGLEEILAGRNNAQIQDNLFVVSGESSDDKLSRLLPQRFSKIVPILKASNFDYIIFDMPSVSQISITPRLASFMDLVLLVIESEKIDQHLVEGAVSLLKESNAHVGSVLNKARNYVPNRLHQESLSTGL
jgi:polysaccharide biosynthesis transport protein